MERVVLDANVLFSNNLRTLFLWLSWNNLIEIVWSKELWDEVFRNYAEDVDSEERFRKMVSTVIFQKFPRAMRRLNAGFRPVGLADKDDEHVVALALQEKAARIVTFNAKDFHEDVLASVWPRLRSSGYYFVRAV